MKQRQTACSRAALQTMGLESRVVFRLSSCRRTKQPE